MSRRDGVVLGCAVTILVSAVPAAVKLSEAVAFGLIGVAILMIMVSLGWWRALARTVRRWISRNLHGLMADGDDAAVGLVCEMAAAHLDELVQTSDLWSKPTRLSKHLANKRLVAEYKKSHRPSVQNAINQARMIVSVPPNIVRYAEEPGSLGDLQLLRDWLRRVAVV